MRSETVDSDMADRIGGAIKGGLAGGLGGVLVCNTRQQSSGMVCWRFRRSLRRRTGRCTGVLDQGTLREYGGVTSDAVRDAAGHVARYLV